MSNNESKKIQIVFEFLTTYALLAVSLIIVFSVLLYTVFSNFAFQRLQDRAVDIAAAVAEGFPAETHSVLQDVTDQDSEEYQEAFEYLNSFRKANPSIEYVYTMRPTGQDKYIWEFVVDADIDEDTNENGVIDEEEMAAVIGEIYDVSCCTEILEAVHGPIADSEITYDQWGDWISGYAPLVTEQGNFVGIVGVDIPASEYQDAKSRINGSIFMMIGVGFVSSLIFGLFGYFIFIREKRKIERSLMIRATDLEKEVKKRTEALQSFVAMIVHDLRSPLVALKWGISMLKEEPDKDQSKVFLDEMEKRTETMLSRVNDLLDASRLDAGKIRLEKKKASLLGIIRGSLKEFKPLAKEKGLKLKSSIQQDLPHFAFDRQRISQVLENLISNAIKYTDVGEIIVRASFDKTKKMVRVEVEDTGRGMSKKDQSQAFELFTSFASGKEVRMSTGLGLAIAKGIIEGHGGSIGIESAEGRGSVFWFEIPAEM